MADIAPNFKLLASIRDAKGWNQADLAAKSGVPAPRLSRYESGSEMPRSDKLIALLGALDVPATVFGDNELARSTTFKRRISEFAFDSFAQRVKLPEERRTQLRRILDASKPPMTAEQWHQVHQQIALYEGRPEPADATGQLIDGRKKFSSKTKRSVGGARPAGA